MLVLKFNDIIAKHVQQQQYQQYQYYKIILSRYSDQPFKIKKAYTKFSGRWSKGTDQEREIDYVQENLDVNLVKKLVDAFQGEPIIIQTSKELYEMYYILHFFQIYELKNQVHNFFIEKKTNILIGCQISEMYEVESLSNFYFTYFTEHGFLDIFNKKLDTEQARKHIYKNRNCLIPEHYLYLNSNIFTKLLCLHNNLSKNNNDKSKFLDQFQIALLISEYCIVNGHDRIKLQAIFFDAVDKDQLTNENKQKILIEFEKQYKTNLTRTISSYSSSEEDNFSDTTAEVHYEVEIAQIIRPSVKPIEIYKGEQLDIKLLDGLKNLQFQFKTKYAMFGFYVSKKIEMNTKIEDEQLYLVNLKNKKKFNTSLKVNWIKFDENTINVNNRLIIQGQLGCCRYEDDVQEPKGDEIKITGCRNFIIEEVQIWYTFNELYFQ